jgi:hypothetical protein
MTDMKSNRPVYSIPWRLRGIVVHPLLYVGQELPVERNNDTFLPILPSGGTDVAIEVDGAHYTLGQRKRTEKQKKLNGQPYEF